MIKGVIFDIDNTLTDFMLTKRAAVDAAVDMMIGAGLKVEKEKMVEMIFDLLSLNPRHPRVKCRG